MRTMMTMMPAAMRVSWGAKAPHGVHHAPRCCRNPDRPSEKDISVTAEGDDVVCVSQIGLRKPYRSRPRTTTAGLCEGGGWRSTSTAAAAAKVSFWRGRATGGEVIDIAARKRECAPTARPSLGTNVAGLWSLRASSSAVVQLTYFLC